MYQGVLKTVMNQSLTRRKFTRREFAFLSEKTINKVWFFVCFCGLSLLFLPNLNLLFTQPHHDILRHQLETANYTDTKDPYGYLSLLSSTFFRNEPSQTFQTPAPLKQLRDIPQQATPESLETLVSQYGLKGKWIPRADTKLNLKRDNSLAGCQMFWSYSDGGLILPVSQPEYHFIALLEAGSDYVYAFDPFVGRVIYPCQQLLEVWEGAAFTAY